MAPNQRSILRQKVHYDESENDEIFQLFRLKTPNFFCKIFAPVPVHRSPRPRLPHTPGEWRHLEVSDIWGHLEVSEVVRETESLGALKNGENYFDIQYYLGLFFVTI